MKNLLDIVSLLYIICVGLICYIFPIPEVIKAVLALPGILIIPQQIGEIAIDILKHLIKEFNLRVSIISKYLFSWIVGVYLLLILTLIFTKFSFWSLEGFIYIIIFLILMKYIFIRKNNKSLITHQSVIDLFSKKYKVIFLIISLMGVLPVLFIKLFQPFPIYYSSFTFFNYHLETLKFVEGGLFNLVSGIHLPIIPFLMGINSIIFNVKPIALFWAMPILHYILFAFGIYLLSYQISKDNKISILATLLGVWGSQTILLKPLDAISMRTILGIIFPFLLFLIYKEFLSKDTFKNEDIKSHILLFFYSILIFLLFFVIIVMLNMKGLFLFLIILPILILLLNKTLKENIRQVSLILLSFTALFSLIHIWNAMISLPILFAFIIFYILLKNYNKKGFIIINMFLFFSFSFFLLQKFKILNLKSGFFSSLIYGDVIETTGFNFLSKFNQLIKYNSEVVIIIFLIGLLLFVLKKDKNNLLVPITAIFALTLYFFPEPQFFRIIMFAIPFIAYTTSLSIIFILKNIINKRNYFLKLLLLCLIIIILISTLIYINYVWIQEKQNSKGYFAPDFELYEYNLSKWIDENTLKEWYDEKTKRIIKTVHDPLLRIGDTRDISIPLTNDTLIISDPHTMWVIQGLTGRDQPIYQRSFVSIKEYAPECIDQMQSIRKDIFLASNSKKAYEKINKIKLDHKVILIVITPRTEIWIKTQNINQQFFTGIYPEINDFNKFEIFYDTAYFTPLYSIENKAYIFGVNLENKNG